MLFCPAGQARAYSRGKKAKIFRLKIKPFGRGKFLRLTRENPLTVARAMLSGLFAVIHQKFGSRRMDVTPDDTI